MNKLNESKQIIKLYTYTDYRTKIYKQSFQSTLHEPTKTYKEKEHHLNKLHKKVKIPLFSCALHYRSNFIESTVRKKWKHLNRFYNFYGSIIKTNWKHLNRLSNLQWKYYKDKLKKLEQTFKSSMEGLTRKSNKNHDSF